MAVDGRLDFIEKEMYECLKSTTALCRLRYQLGHKANLGDALCAENELRSKFRTYKIRARIRRQRYVWKEFAV